MPDGEEVLVLDFAEEQAGVCGGAWLQGRYYADDGERVRDVLSFDSVFDICPFEVGADRRSDRRAHRRTLDELSRLLELRELMPRAFTSLSNGEMRRVLFARAVLKRPRRMVLVSPMDGLDPVRRVRFARAVEAIRSGGIDIRVRGGRVPSEPVRRAVGPFAPRGRAERMDAPAVVELNGVTLRFGGGTVLKDFSWTIRRGERWLLRGPNGSGKTTLLALITGDSPLAYAYDVRVFGVPRATGRDLSVIRRRIASVSPEMQAYLGLSPEAAVARALAKEPELLLLDEPCCNLGVAASRRLLSTVEKWLKTHPQTTAVCVAHCAAHIPAGCDRLLDLSALSRPPPAGLTSPTISRT